MDRVKAIRCVRFKGTSIATTNVGLGGTGGSVSRPYCRSGGDYARYIQVKVGSWMDRFEVFCRAQP
ncbi:MAG: hypothetical protein AB7R55_13545 [Gemmatimonadales bacterium]